MTPAILKWWSGQEYYVLYLNVRGLFYWRNARSGEIRNEDLSSKFIAEFIRHNKSYIHQQYWIDIGIGNRNS